MQLRNAARSLRARPPENRGASKSWLRLSLVNAPDGPMMSRLFPRASLMPVLMPRNRGDYTGAYRCGQRHASPRDTYDPRAFAMTRNVLYLVLQCAGSKSSQEVLRGT
ncbi:MAG: hypothetical protein RMJ19_04165 [Gemmatales bacterium]|nr:hypothetical protein [Gemmatales bacterium]MDW8174842.1 hypothetical protein [Gemmatales bacterium]